MRLLFTILISLFVAETCSSQTQLNVTNYGAVGDTKTNIIISCTSNSTTVGFTNSISAADVGKVIEIFRGGRLGTSTTNQDYIGKIVSVSGTNAVLNNTVSNTGALYCVYGTLDTTPFQNCINAAPSNSVITVPSGTYLIIGLSNFYYNFPNSAFNTYPSLVVTNGGLIINGAGQGQTVLLGCGAWTIQGGYAYRGHMFGLTAPIQNRGSFTLENMTIDGGVYPGYTGYFGFPALTDNGDGWDVTHDAVINEGSGTPMANQYYYNLTVTNWRGEQFKSTQSGADGGIIVSNCSFTQGDASGLNFSFSMTVENCYFANLSETMEFYQAYCSNTCYFQNNFVTNMGGAIMAINGGTGTNPTFNIAGNTFYITVQNGIQTTPGCNLNIFSNVFYGGGYPVTLGVAGYQGSFPNTNIIISANVFSNSFWPIVEEGNGNNSVFNVVVSNNTSYNLGNAFAYGFGYGSNVLFANNTMNGSGAGLNSTGLTGQFFIDDPSNVFPYHEDDDTSGITNIVSYTYGMRHKIAIDVAGSVFKMDDTVPYQIPPVAELLVSNSATFTVPVYFGESTSSHVNLSTGQSVLAYWNPTISGWQTGSPQIIVTQAAIHR